MIPIPGRDLPIRMSACLVVLVDEQGRVTRIDEYIDRGDVASLLLATS